MFNRIGTGELILILAIALVVVGPSKLPELGKAFGKTINEFRKFSKDIQDDLSLDEKPKKAESKKEEKEEAEVKVAKEEKEDQAN
jgi:sec-independent protein translocase protein TatA